MSKLSDSRVLPHIAIIREMLLTLHYNDESRWLGLAVLSKELCRSATAQNALKRTIALARKFGFPDVATWICREVLLQELSLE